MKRPVFNKVWTLSLALLLLAATAIPAMAQDKVNLNVNGDFVNFSGLYQENGVSFVPLESFSRFSGTDVNRVTAEVIEIVGGDTVLVLELGQREALLNGKAVPMPAAPVLREQDVMVPLRFAGEAFGFNVDWDNQQQLVLLSRDEVRDGTSAIELLAKSNQVIADINTYSMNGDISTTVDAIVDGSKSEQLPMNMNTNIYARYQNNPMKIYMKVTVLPMEGVDMPESVMETYMTEEHMYVKSPEQEWMVQDMNIPVEFWREQQDIQSDPIKAVQQMKDLGMLVNYGNDVTMDGKEYYTVNSTLDPNKFRESYQQLMEQMMSGVAVSDDTGTEDIQGIMQQIMEKMSLDYFCTAYINKETLVSDMIKMDLKLNLAMNPSDFAGDMPSGEAAESGGEIPEEIEMNMVMQGEIWISEIGEAFAAPDISNAIPMTVQ